MDVAEDRPGRHRGGRRLATGLAEQALEIERQRRHLDRVRRHRPLVARPVTVELDAVPLRIGEVERLRDEVVGRTRERPTGAGHPAQRACQVCPGRHEQRKVKEPGRPRRTRRRVRPWDELDERPPLDAERDESLSRRRAAGGRRSSRRSPAVARRRPPAAGSRRAVRQPVAGPSRAASSSSAHELMQNRLPVGCGPSSKTCPRCPPQVAQTTSSRTIRDRVEPHLDGVELGRLDEARPARARSRTSRPSETAPLHTRRSGRRRAPRCRCTHR